jgi:hypothetical protein
MCDTYGTQRAATQGTPVNKGRVIIADRRPSFCQVAFWVNRGKLP